MLRYVCMPTYERRYRLVVTRSNEVRCEGQTLRSKTAADAETFRPQTTTG